MGLFKSVYKCFASKEFNDDKDFFDVTLACHDAKIEAQKVILKAYRRFFGNNVGMILKTTCSEFGDCFPGVVQWSWRLIWCYSCVWWH